MSNSHYKYRFSPDGSDPPRTPSSLFKTNELQLQRERAAQLRLVLAVLVLFQL